MPYHINIEQTQQNESYLKTQKQTQKESESETIEGELTPFKK